VKDEVYVRGSMGGFKAGETAMEWGVRYQRNILTGGSNIGREKRRDKIAIEHLPGTAGGGVECYAVGEEGGAVEIVVMSKTPPMRFTLESDEDKVRLLIT
jgi:hypothetical protein